MTPASDVGLSVQFFNKTRRNIPGEPCAQVIVVTPETTDQYRMELEFERTETAGALLARQRQSCEDELGNQA
jgi:hypothetical protein